MKLNLTSLHFRKTVQWSPFRVTLIRVTLIRVTLIRVTRHRITLTDPNRSHHIDTFNNPLHSSSAPSLSHEQSHVFRTLFRTLKRHHTLNHVSISISISISKLSSKNNATQWNRSILHLIPPLLNNNPNRHTIQRNKRDRRLDC